MGRRMLSSDVVLTDAFLDLEPTARCLYITLSVLADDEGFCASPRSAMRQSGASEADLTALVEDGFLFSFPDKVVCIRHWNVNNQLRPDRIKPTKHQDDREKLFLTEDGIYVWDVLPEEAPTEPESEPANEPEGERPENVLEISNITEFPVQNQDCRNLRANDRQMTADCRNPRQNGSITKRNLTKRNSSCARAREGDFCGKVENPVDNPSGPTSVLNETFAQRKQRLMAQLAALG